MIDKHDVRPALLLPSLDPTHTSSDLQGRFLRAHDEDNAVMRLYGDPDHNVRPLLRPQPPISP